MTAVLRERDLVAVADACVWAPTETQAAFLQAVVSTQARLDEALWGSEEGRTSAALGLLAATVHAVRSLAVDSLTTAEAAELLDASPPAIRRLLRSRILVGVRLRTRWLVPMWQFVPDTESGVVPALRELQDVFPGDAIALSEWVARDNVELGGRAPLHALLDGDGEAVIAAARSTTAAAM